MYALPPFPTPFIGRQDELAEIGRLLADPSCRLLTLVGPGGIGKTRLAVEATKPLLDAFAHGVYFVNFQPVSSTDFLASTITDAVHMPLSGQEDPRVRLLNFLSNKVMLLVLDSFEHLLDGADLLTEMLQAAPGIKLMVTSREVLNLQEEWLYPVRGMPFPETDDSERLEEYSAVQLFVERARRVRRNFSLAAEESGVIRICRIVEGMPLAIELAASWTKTLPCAEIANEVQRNLDFLATPLRNVPERHRSMQAVFEQAWRRLTDEECAVFRKLSVFRGGFQYAAAEKVAGASLQILLRLVDKSLLTCEASGRYQMHELLRQYGEAHLRTFPEEANRARDLHLAYYTDFMQERDEAMQDSRQLQATREFEAELENIRRAWQGAVEQVNVEAIGMAAPTLSLFYHYTSRYLEASDAFDKAVYCLESSGQQEGVLALALVNQGWFALRLGQVEKARSAFERGHTIYQSLNIPPPVVGAVTEPLNGLSMVAVVSGDYARAIRLGEQARQACEARGDKTNRAFAYYVLTSASLAQGDYQAARQYAQKACAIAQALNLRWFAAYCLIELGNATRALGNLAEARQHYQASYAIREEFDDAEGMAVALNHLGKVASLQGDYQEAKRLYGHSLTLYHNLGDRGGLATALVGLGMAACSLGEDQAARQHFHDALYTALDAQLIPLALSILVSTAELLVLTGQYERGVELLALTLHHTASDHDTKQRAQQLFTRSQTQLPSGVFAEAEQRGATGDFNTVAATLLDDLSAVRMTTVASPAPLANWTMVESLTERELEILRLIADGLSNRDIADRLILSLGTVKWYTGQIYSKLGVQNRAQAVGQAQKRKLLS